MISHEHKFIFIHIPRTGGSAIEQQLKRNSIGFVDKYTKHKTLFCIEKQFDVADYFKFSFIRNPWDIMVSKYFAPIYKKINYLSGKPLDYFLKNYTGPAGEETVDLFYEYFDPKKMDFIGRYENRDVDLDYISSKIGFNISKDHSAKEMQKKQSDKHYTEYYDDETRSIVAEKYAKDIEYFGYEFGE